MGKNLLSCLRRLTPKDFEIIAHAVRNHGPQEHRAMLGLKDFGDAATARDLISFLSRKVVIDALHADEASGFFQPGVALAVARKLEDPTAAVAVEDRSEG
jgi:hypothetical protein